MTYSPNSAQNTASPRTFAYLRMSTLKQDNSKNKADILLFANSKQFGNVEFYEEFCSGKTNWKERKIGHILEIAQPKDRIIVSEFSRLARSMLQCLEILSVAMEKQISIYAIKGNWTLDDSIQSKVLAFAFSLASEIERDLISARTVEALKAKREAGIVLGRPRGIGKSRLDQYRPEILGLLSNGASQVFISQRFHVSPVTVCLWMKKHNIQKPAINPV